MENKRTAQEEVCIVRYADSEVKYETVATSEELREAIKSFVGASDYEVQYMGGALSKNATDYVLELMELAEEYETDLKTVGALYNFYLDLSDVERILEDRNYMEISGSNRRRVLFRYGIQTKRH